MNVGQIFVRFFNMLCPILYPCVTCLNSIPLKLQKKPKRYPSKIRKQFATKASLWRKYRIDKCISNKHAFDRAAKECKHSTFKHECELERNILSSGDLGQFYKIVNSKLSCKSGIAPLMDKNEKLVFDNAGKAELLNQYFSAVCIKDNNNLPEYNSIPVSTELSLVQFNSNEIFKILKKLKSSMASGPDGIPPIFLKQLASHLAAPMQKLFTSLFHFESLPKMWKQALVTPIFKKGKSSKVENYRPISLTCVACKVFESVIKPKLVNFLTENNCINSSQHGFVAKHSTCTNLLESLNDWTINIRRGNFTRVAYIDFAKAFDSVCHSKLVFKLGKMGITGSLLRILESFLKDRSQKVVIEGICSSVLEMRSGVPQGSVLGPILFIVYINDLSSIFPQPTVSKYFADDAKLYTEISTVDDIDTLQFNLDSLSTWANSWQLAISIHKCCTMDMITSKKQENSFYENTVDGMELDNVLMYKDLGIYFDSNLSFKSHISHVVTTAKQRTFLLFRCFLTKDTKSLLLGYKSYILPLLNYCSPVWSPSSVGDILLLESVQRVFTKKIPGLENKSYLERIKILNLHTLELRRLHSDLTLCYKILHGLVAGPPGNYGLVLANRQSRGHSYKLAITYSRVDVRKYFFGCRVAEPWNSLSDNVVASNSLKIFKTLLKRCCFNKFLLFTE